MTAHKILAANAWCKGVKKLPNLGCGVSMPYSGAVFPGVDGQDNKQQLVGTARSCRLPQQL